MKESDAKPSKIIDTFIEKTPLFNGLPEKQLEELSHIATNSLFKRGETIFSEGDDANGFYVLRSGRVNCFSLRDRMASIFRAMEGSFLINSIKAFFEKKIVLLSSNASAWAGKVSPVKTGTSPKGSPGTMIWRVCSFPSKESLKILTRLVENLSLKEVPQRLASYFLFVSSRENEDVVELDMAKGQLASILGTIPETLSRILSKMVNQDLIRVQGRTIKLIDKKGLEEVVTGEKTLL